MSMGIIAVASVVVGTGLSMYQANQAKQDAKGVANASRSESKPTTSSISSSTRQPTESKYHAKPKRSGW